jgi:predicted anti-sigma-YlaC factor YlaD
MNPLNTSCKKATYLVSKKEEARLSFLEKIQLRSHLAICSMCRKFESQTGFIGRMARHTHMEVTLSPEVKERMQAALENGK